MAPVTRDLDDNSDRRSIEEEKRFFEFFYAFCFELLKKHTNPVRALSTFFHLHTCHCPARQAVW